jgi:cell division protein FtsI (penicillin-binding protein 3)
MEEVVVAGTGKKAQVDNYRTGGKTGTTRKSHRLDQREYIASFIGAIPIDDPQLTIFCSIDNPKGAYYAGEVSAPLFKEVATAALAQLAIAPTGLPKTDASRIARAAQPKPDPEQVANAMFHAVSERMVTGPDQMPDLAGMTMNEVRRALLGTQLNVRFLGKGYVMDQSPAPGTPLESTTQAVVIFRDSVRPSEDENPERAGAAATSAPALRKHQTASGTR